MLYAFRERAILATWFSTAAWSCFVFLSGGCTHDQRVQPETLVVKRFGPILISTPERIEHTFTVSNPTATTVRILKISKSCGCLDAEFDTDEIVPDGTAMLKMAVNAIPNATVQAFNTVVQTDSIELKELVFRFEVESYPRVSSEENRLEFVFAGLLKDSYPVENEKMFHFEVYRESGEIELPPSEIEFACPLPFSAEVVDVTSRTVSDHVVTDRFQVRVRGASEHLPLEDGQGFVTVGVKGRGFSSLSIPIIWSVRYIVSFSPRPVFFGLFTNENEEKVKIVRLVADDGCAFRILKGRTESQDIQLDWDSDVSRSAHELKAVLKSNNNAAGAIRGKITLELDHPAVAHLQIPWSALIVRRH